MPSPATQATEHTAVRDAVLEHLWRCYPGHCLILTDPRTRHAVDFGIARATRHGFVDVSVVRPYIGLMTLLGSHFDEDPQLPWVRERLRRGVGVARRTAMRELLEEVAAKLTPVIGARGEYYQRGLAWLGLRSIDTLVSNYGQTHEGLTLLLRHLHLRKLETLSPDAVDRLIQRARTAARARGSTSTASTIVHLGLMYMLGSGIGKDPFHPWVSETIVRSGTADPAAATLQLHEAAMDYLRRTIAVNAVSNTGSQP